MNVRAYPSALRGELVNDICMEEPIYWKCSEGLVFVNIGSSSACIEGRARQREQKGGARLLLSTVKGSSSVSVRARPLVLKGELVRMSDLREEPVCFTAKGSSSVSVRARPLVLKGELVGMSNWAHGMSNWARLCTL